MFDLDKVYPLHFLVKHLKCHFSKDVFPMENAPQGNLVFFSWGSSSSKPLSP